MVLRYNASQRSAIMKRHSFMLACILAIIVSLLSTAAVFAEGDEPEGDPPEHENPVILFLAGISGADPGDIAGAQEGGYSLGNVARSYLFAELTGGDASDALGESHGKGWGVMFKGAGLEPGGGGRGLGWMIGKGHTRPEHANGRPDHAGKPDRPDREGTGRPPWAGGDGTDDDDTGD
jgi:hypothetical protein